MLLMKRVRLAHRNRTKEPDSETVDARDTSYSCLIDKLKYSTSKSIQPKEQKPG